MKLSEARAMRAAILEAAKHLSDAVAATAPMLFPRWKVGKAYVGGERLCYSGKLYKVKDGMPHTSQADWTPDVAVSMYERIDVEHTGTIADPTPFVTNMELEQGKYYTEGGVIYYCYNGSGNAVHGALAHMEAFVKVVSEA